MPGLSAEIQYDISKDKFSMSSEMTLEGLVEIIENFIRGQMGEGEDKTAPNEQDVYHFRITWDPTEDDIRVSSDTGNKGLREGILMHFLRHVDEGKVKDPEDKTEGGVRPEQGRAV